MKKQAIITIVALLLLASCSQKNPSNTKEANLNEAITAINEANESYVNFYNSRNAAGVASLHTEDAMVMPPNFDFAIGKAQIQAAISAEIEMGAGGLKFTQLELVVKDNIAYEIGLYELKVEAEGQPTIEDNGKFIVIWEKQEDGKWLMEKDIWNTNVPLAVAE